eukprot:30294-Pelagococcus_subviridis.AAC.92
MLYSFDTSCDTLSDRCLSISAYRSLVASNPSLVGFAGLFVWSRFGCSSASGAGVAAAFSISPDRSRITSKSSLKRWNSSFAAAAAAPWSNGHFPATVPMGTRGVGNSYAGFFTISPFFENPGQPSAMAASASAARSC